MTTNYEEITRLGVGFTFKQALFTYDSRIVAGVWSHWKEGDWVGVHANENKETGVDTFILAPLTGEVPDFLAKGNDFANLFDASDLYQVAVKHANTEAGVTGWAKKTRRADIPLEWLPDKE